MIRDSVNVNDLSRLSMGLTKQTSRLSWEQSQSACELLRRSFCSEIERSHLHLRSHILLSRRERRPTEAVAQAITQTRAGKHPSAAAKKSSSGHPAPSRRLRKPGSACADGFVGGANNVFDICLAGLRGDGMRALFSQAQGILIRFIYPRERGWTPHNRPPPRPPRRCLRSG